MERNIVIFVKDKVAYAPKDARIVCNNYDYTITFDFDDEWNSIETKTARFSANGKNIDVVFTGNSVNAPPIYNAAYVKIGVFAPDITTTYATIRCEESILCEGGVIADPLPDVYAQIIDLLNQLKENEVTDEEIKKAVTEYLTENPVKMFNTDETLTLDLNTNTLSVNRTNDVEQDNTLPITSAGVYATVGNIESLLKTI